METMAADGTFYVELWHLGLTAITMVVGVIYWFFRYINKPIAKWREDIDKKISDLEKWQTEMKIWQAEVDGRLHQGDSDMKEIKEDLKELKHSVDVLNIAVAKIQSLLEKNRT